MKINQLKIGALLSYFQKTLGIIVSLAYTPIMIRMLGQSEYGLYNIVASTISMLSVLSLGFNNSYVRYFSKYNANNDKDSISKLNGLFIIVFSIIGFICFLCGIYLYANIEMVFDIGLTASEYITAKKLMLLLTVNLSISFPMSVFANIVLANEKFIFLRLLSIMNTIGGPLVTLPILLMGYRSVALVLSSLFLSVTADIIYFIYVFIKLKNRFVFHGFEKGLFSSLFAYSAFIALNIIVDQINCNIDKFIIGRYKGTIEVAIYSVGFNLYNHYLTFSTAVSSVFVPRVHKIVTGTKIDSLEQRTRLTEIFTRIGRIQFLILALLATGITFFGQKFIHFWAGEGYEKSYIIALIFIFSSTIPLIQNLGIEIQRAQNRHQFRSIVYVVMALGNLGMTIALCQIMGAVGAVIGTAISLLLANGLVMNIYYYKKCNIDIPAFWKSIFRLSLGLIVPVIFGIVLQRFVVFDSILKLLVGIIAYTVIYVAFVWWFGMNEYEKNLVKIPIKKVLKRC